MQKIPQRRMIALGLFIVPTIVMYLVLRIDEKWPCLLTLYTFFLCYLPMIVSSIAMSIIGLCKRDRKSAVPLVLSMLSMMYFIVPWDDYFYTRHTDLWLLFQDRSRTHLYLDDTNITDRGMETISTFVNLETLIIYNSSPNSGVTDRGFQFVGRLSNLERMRVSNVMLTDIGLRHLKGLKKLAELSIHGAPVSDDGLSSIVSLERLNILDLDSRHISGAGLVRLTQVTHLGLHGPNINNTTLPYICRLSNLRFLGLYSTRVDDGGADTIMEMKGLNYLDIQNSMMSDRILQELREGLPDLHH